MVAIALVLLVQAEASILIALPAAVIIGREITVSALREWMAEIGARAQVAVSMAGKLKTTAQMIAIVLLILHVRCWVFRSAADRYDPALHRRALTLWSMILYLRAAWPSLTKTD
jgi:phosphatidylglycerophosphate synthase